MRNKFFTPKGHREEHISHENSVGHMHESTGFINGYGHHKYHMLPDGEDPIVKPTGNPGGKSWSNDPTEGSCADGTPTGHQEGHISHQNGVGHMHDSTGYSNGVGHQKFHCEIDDVTEEPCEANGYFGGQTAPRGHQEDHISHMNGVGHMHDSTGYSNGAGHQKFHAEDMCDLMCDCPCDPCGPDDPDDPDGPPPPD